MLKVYKRIFILLHRTDFGVSLYLEDKEHAHGDEENGIKNNKWYLYISTKANKRKPDYIIIEERINQIVNDYNDQNLQSHCRQFLGDFSQNLTSPQVN
ncbi:hypothetical protein BpHYR1_027409 [Brachionus plicatilis]|uniref:Uncharacterized protein n=1 Tax=Brachionus plicatilis TaxID=10195 RepID=A0A3M7QVG8_BRAPC|nr:hypothetical protein BpHYR1_027409 [Brachionus plicatilis]